MATKKASQAKAKEPLPALQPKKAIVNGTQKQIFIIDDATELDDLSSLQCVSLLHPKHGKPARYLHTARSIWEVQRVYQPPSSWIIKHDIQEDGSFYMCTRIDPLFLALPLLERGRKKTDERDGYFLQLDQLLSKADFPVSLLGKNGAIGDEFNAHTLCDVRDGWQESVVRLSDEKVVDWLRAKVERMRHAFKAIPSLQHHYTPAERQETPEAEKTRLEQAAEASKALSEVSEQKESSADGADASSSSSAAASSSPSPIAPVSPASSSLKQCLAFLSEYLPPYFFSLLLTSYSLRVEDVFEKKRAVRREWDADGGGKISGDIDTSRPAGAPANTTGDKRKVEKPLSAAAKKLATAAKGTKSLASFFTKKA